MKSAFLFLSVLRARGEIILTDDEREMLDADGCSETGTIGEMEYVGMIQ